MRESTCDIIECEYIHSFKSRRLGIDLVVSEILQRSHVYCSISARVFVYMCNEYNSR